MRPEDEPGEADAAGAPLGHLRCEGYPLPAAVHATDNGSSCLLLWNIALGDWKPLHPRDDRLCLWRLAGSD